MLNRLSILCKTLCYCVALAVTHVVKIFKRPSCKFDCVCTHYRVHKNCVHSREKKKKSARQRRSPCVMFLRLRRRPRQSNHFRSWRIAVPVCEESVSHRMHKWTPSHKCIVTYLPVLFLATFFFCIVRRTCCWNPVTNAPASNRRFAYTSTDDYSCEKYGKMCNSRNGTPFQAWKFFAPPLRVFCNYYYYYYYVHLYWEVRAGEESCRRAGDVNVISSTVFLNILYIYKNLH